MDSKAVSLSWSIGHDTVLSHLDVRATLGLLALVILLGLRILPTKFLARNDSVTSTKIEDRIESRTLKNLIDAFTSQQNDAVVFFGSQTGTAEEFARRLAKSLQSDYNLRVIVEDLEAYEVDTINQITTVKTAKAHRPLVFYIMATYGDGEPTDNATEFCGFLRQARPAFASLSDGDDKQPLEGFRYAAFGLGNSTYAKFNEVIHTIDKDLRRLGADRLGDVGEADDGTGTSDEDFLSWKNDILESVSVCMNLQRSEHTYVPSFIISERQDLNLASDAVYLGERDQNQLSNSGLTKPPFNTKNPYHAPILETRQLFAPTCNRHCLHIEFDIAETGMSYTTGDHLGVWPTNPESEVIRLLRMIGLHDKRDDVVSIQLADTIQQSGMVVPQPTTLATVLRYRLEICGRISREFVTSIAPMAPSAEARNRMMKLAKDSAQFASHVTSRHLNLGQLLQEVSQGEPWTLMPFSILLESIPPLQPRYYSISSSSMVFPNAIHVTAAVKTEGATSDPYFFKGLTSNYLMAQAECKASGSNLSDYQIKLPRAIHEGGRTPIHVRKSSFRLPVDPSVPIIMVGPGTGAAPFRAFLQERLCRKKAGCAVGLSVLFTGCRLQREDYMYEDEWNALKDAMGEHFIFSSAFSRESSQKVYVQHHIKTRSIMIRDLIKHQGAWLYICGDAANMAKDVHQALASILTEPQQETASSGDDYIKSLKLQGRWHEDVW